MWKSPREILDKIDSSECRQLPVELKAALKKLIEEVLAGVDPFHSRRPRRRQMTRSLIFVMRTGQDVLSGV